jgi:septum formation protein
LIHQQLAHKGIELVLGSASPRRESLLRDMGLTFTKRVSHIEETYPPTLTRGEIASYLARAKADALKSTLSPHEWLLTSDTVVWCNHTSLEKASTRQEAAEMLKKLSGGTHHVFSAICLTATTAQETWLAETRVTFKALSNEEIDYYLTIENPFDKAGAYGIQDWIGLVGITAIEGSYFTVMGLPTHLVYRALSSWLSL